MLVLGDPWAPEPPVFRDHLLYLRVLLVLGDPWDQDFPVRRDPLLHPRILLVLGDPWDLQVLVVLLTQVSLEDLVSHGFQVFPVFLHYLSVLNGKAFRF